MVKNLKKITLIFSVTVLIDSCKTKKEAVTNTINKKPNVLLLFSDQHNKKTMGYENHPDIITPNLVKLSNESVVFDRTLYHRHLCAIKNIINDGFIPKTLGLLNNSVATSVIDESVSMATIFKYNNYNTYTFGKRHLSGGADKVWDVKMNINKVDYRKFGDMYFDRNSDPLEIHNGIENNKYKNSIKQLRNYYSKFEKAVPDTGKQELINKTLNKK